MATVEPNTGSDMFDDLINIEDRFYRQGYDQGIRDGALAGKVEGRSLGLEKGFEKFLEAGRLYGKAVVWADRLRLQSAIDRTVEPSAANSLRSPAAEEVSAVTTEQSTTQQRLLPLSRNPRLAKNVESVHALMEPATLSTKNEDDAVNDFDDRLKKAQGKAKIVEKMIGGSAVSKQEPPADERKDGPLQSPRQEGGGW